MTPAEPTAANGTAWRGTLGAIVGDDGQVDFRVWAPTARALEVVVDRAGDPAQTRPLTRGRDGVFTLTWPGLGAGARYHYLLDGDGPLPDPASRFQPGGVHGPSTVVDPAYAWSDHEWPGVPLEALSIYELHVGTFSPAGTFAGVTAQLPALRALGVSCLELMPVADFPGARNWGYDGAALFAPARCYGTPDELRRLVDTAHALGLAVLLDVVYNHTGPDGSYLGRFSPYYFTDRHASPWGAGLDVDGEHSRQVREFFIENALHWVHEYHMDGLRLDATHAIHDHGPRHFLAELTARVKASVSGRHVHVIAEDHRNLAMMVAPPEAFGWGLDAVWADDFHHQMRRLLAGDRDGYYRDFSGTAADLATTLRQGWFYTGQHSEHLQEARGTDPSDVAAAACVVCLQNHDQVGNRARGERLHHQIDAAAFRAASVVLLTAPETPLLFMGQEWAASSPFLYFTDHAEPLGRLVTEGRRREFQDFSAFADPAAAESIPDPQAPSTFLASRLDWSERDREPHASTLRLYTALLDFRRTHLTVDGPLEDFAVEALDDDTILMIRTNGAGVSHLIVARLRGAGPVDLGASALVAAMVGGWTRVLTSEDPAFSAATAVDVDCSGATPVVWFAGPAAVILKATLPRAAAWAETRDASATPPARPGAPS